MIPQDFRIQPCLSPVWDTAINVIALAESGLDAASIRRSQRAARGCASKEVRFRGDWQREESAPGSERLGLRIQQRVLSRHRRHDDGADGAAPGSDRTTDDGRSETVPACAAIGC